MTAQTISERSGMRVTIKLGRRLLSTILTVYLPTLLLNVIGHTTVYFKPFFFEVSKYLLLTNQIQFHHVHLQAIISVNLTVMLVLTTM